MCNKYEDDKIGKLVIIANDYPAHNHMRLVFVQQLVEAMVEEGTRVSVIAPQSISHALVHKEKLLPREAYYITPKGIEYEVYRPYIITLGNRNFLSGGLNLLNNAIISRILKKVRPSTLYAHFWSSALFVAPYARKKKIPLFVACGEGDNAIEEMIKALSITELNNLSKIVTGVVSVSSENKRRCIAYNLAESDIIGVFPNCVDTELFKPIEKKDCRAVLGISNNDFVIAFVGGFIPRKGPDKLAKAISEINDPSIKVFFIGKEFPGYPFYFDCPGVILKESIDHNKLNVYLGAADIFVLPTQNEGCSNAIVEALAMGLPVISSEGAFNDDILDEYNSIRVDPNDVNSIKEAILKLKGNPILLEQMRLYSLSKHNSYSVRGRAKRIIAFIREKLS